MSSSSLLLSSINHQLPRAASLTSLTDANLIESRIHSIVIRVTSCVLPGYYQSFPLSSPRSRSMSEISHYWVPSTLQGGWPTASTQIFVDCMHGLMSAYK